nr:Chain A, Jacalin-type lectin domain-containing protein [Musa acuminata]7KMU_B Chain B, Jacalin-type lectin domain-containing protein [Musa acuminata]
MAGAIKVGTWGGNGGSEWDMGPAYRIDSVKINAGDIIDAIEITFTRYGLTETQHYGGTGGEPHEIAFEDGEYIMSMEGHVVDYFGLTIIGKLTLTTNRRTFGPFGAYEGTPFSIPVAEGKIAGFFGRAGSFIDAIGVYLMPNLEHHHHHH